MATQSSISQLGENGQAFIYREIILPWENGLKNADFSDLRSARLDEFESMHGISRMAFETANECSDFLNTSKKRLPSSYVYFNSSKKAQTGMIFRHFRNAFSHAHFEYQSSWFELFAVTASGEFNMKARLRKADLEGYVALLKKGAKTKSGEVI